MASGCIWIFFLHGKNDFTKNLFDRIVEEVLAPWVVRLKKEFPNIVRHYIEVGGRDGRFALLFCNLGATTPPENVKAAMDAVYRYGQYSMNTTMLSI